MTDEQVKRDWVEGWLDKARRDLAAADVLLGSGVDVTDAVAFHARQAAEKALKAFLPSVSFWCCVQDRIRRPAFELSRSASSRPPSTRRS
jgi:hypothetical protein